MAPSDIPDEEVIHNALVQSEKKTHTRIDSNGNSKPGNAPPTESKEKKKKDSQEQSKPKDNSKDSKLSGAELKKKAKEEKAAKRARDKQNQQQPSTEGSGHSRTDAPNNKIKKGAVSSGPETQHKRTGSISANQPKILPQRSGEMAAAAASPEPKKEDKKVALFGHLYGNPRRTTIAGATKDVHPAVLALGLQMSNYVICGSNARCVATMLVFKRVRQYFN